MKALLNTLVVQPIWGPIWDRVVTTRSKGGVQEMLSSQAKRNKNKVRVAIQIEGRSDVEGYMFTLAGERIIDLLNDERSFLPLELLSGDTIIVRKSEIQMIEEPSEGQQIDPLLFGTASEIFEISENTTYADLQSTLETKIKTLHPDLVARAGLHSALSDCARMLTERLIRNYDVAVENLTRQEMRLDRIRRAQAEMEEDRAKRKIAHRSA